MNRLIGATKGLLLGVVLAGVACGLIEKLMQNLSNPFFGGDFIWQLSLCHWLLCVAVYWAQSISGPESS